MKVSDLIKENADKQKLLSEENNQIYGDILLYIRSSAVDEEWAEETLFEILNHLLDAQEKGKSARDIFGEDTKAYCEELLAELPKESWRKRLGYASFLLIPLAFYIIPDALFDELSLSVFNGLLAPAFFLLTIYSFFWALKKEVYSSHKVLYYLIPGFCFFLALSMSVLHEIIDVKSITIDGRLSIVIGTVLLILCITFYVKWKFWDALLFLLVLSGIVIGVEFGYINEMAAVIVTIILLVLYQLFSIWFFIRKHS